MKLEIINGSENYVAQVVVIKEVYPIPDADKIQRVVIDGNDIVTSMDVKPGDKMIYFCSGIRLNEEYCKTNNLLDSYEANADKTQKGYISYKQFRVKAVRLRGVVSNGMLMPISSLEYINPQIANILLPGEQFNKIGDLLLCEKYVVAARNSNPGGKAPVKVKLKNLLVKDQFKLHTDTAHFAKNLGKFSSNDNVVITRKYHGTSGISSHVLVQRSLSLIERLLLWLGVNIPTTEYGYVYSSGKPRSGLPKGIFNSNSKLWSNENKSYYTEDYWLKAFNKLKDKLEKGITLYYEVVGKGIQGNDYSYGFDHEMFVYRITQTNADGITYEFTWQQVKDYCDKYGIKYVDEYWISSYDNLNAANIFEKSDLIDSLSKKYLNKSLPDCKVDEGICIRNETTNEIFKLKSPNFILAESNMQEKEISNIEDEQ